eukprot:922789-Alexandrium_andersonii.AAC.1
MATPSGASRRVTPTSPPGTSSPPTAGFPRTVATTTWSSGRSRPRSRSIAQALPARASPTPASGE